MKRPITDNKYVNANAVAWYLIRPSDKRGLLVNQRPQCAFKKKVLSVSCNSHQVSQLAAFFLEPKTEWSPAMSCIGYFFFARHKRDDEAFGYLKNMRVPNEVTRHLATLNTNKYHHSITTRYTYHKVNSVLWMNLFRILYNQFMRVPKEVDKAFGYLKKFYTYTCNCILFWSLTIRGLTSLLRDY